MRGRIEVYFYKGNRPNTLHVHSVRCRAPQTITESRMRFLGANVYSVCLGKLSQFTPVVSKGFGSVLQREEPNPVNPNSAAILQFQNADRENIKTKMGVRSLQRSPA